MSGTPMATPASGSSGSAGRRWRRSRSSCRRRTRHCGVRHRCLAVLLLVTACGASSEPPPASTSLTVPAGAQQATVVRHTDGDTLWLRGIGVGPVPAAPTKVRLLEIDTPEIHPTPQCFGPEAADRIEQLLPLGARVRVEAARERRDRYG